MWQAKGGGFYGLGYVVSLLVLEARTLTGDIVASDGVTSFVTSQLVGYVIRFSAESFVNAMLAFAWPMWLIQWLGPWAIPVLVGGYVAFEYALRPHVESRFPELHEARLAKAEAKARRKSV